MSIRIFLDYENYKSFSVYNVEIGNASSSMRFRNRLKVAKRFVHFPFSPGINESRFLHQFFSSIHTICLSVLVPIFIFSLTKCSGVLPVEQFYGIQFHRPSRVFLKSPSSFSIPPQLSEITEYFSISNIFCLLINFPPYIHLFPIYTVFLFYHCRLRHFPFHMFSATAYIAQFIKFPHLFNSFPLSTLTVLHNLLNLSLFLPNFIIFSFSIFTQFYDFLSYKYTFLIFSFSFSFFFGIFFMCISFSIIEIYRRQTLYFFLHLLSFFRFLLFS